MTILPSSKTAWLLAAFFLSCCALFFAPLARATEWIIGAGSPSGTTAFPPANDPPWANGDIITLLSDVTRGNSPALINFSAATTAAGFTMRSGVSGQWITVSNTAANPSANLRVLSTYAANLTYAFSNIIFASNTTSAGNGHGAAIYISDVGASTSATTTITGTMAFLNNCVSSAFNGGAIHNALGYLVLSGSILFDSNYAGANGGAINIAATSRNATFDGDILFTSNTAMAAGGAFNYQNNTTGATSGTAFFNGLARFLDNYAGQQGGAIATNNAGANALAFSGTTYFEGNASAGVGGAIYAGGKGLYIGGSTAFVNNKAGGQGGAIMQQNSAVTSAFAFTLDATNGSILFQGNTENMGADFSAPGDRNAITFYTGSAANMTTNVILNTAALGAGGAGNILFYDPISVSDTTNWGTTQAHINLTQTGNGTVLYDTFRSVMTGTTTIQSGTMLLTNGAIYGSGAADAASAAAAGVNTLVFNLQSPATLAGNGAVQAGVINFANGAQIDVTTGGTLSLLATSFTGTGLRISGNGTIDTGGLPITASLVSVGSIVSGTPGAPAPANTAQTLIFGPSAPLTLAAGGTIAIDLFGNTADHLVVDTFSFTPGAANISLSGLSGTAVITTANAPLAASDFTVLVNGLAPTSRYTASGTTVADANGGSGGDLYIYFLSHNINTRWTGAASGPAGSAAIWANTQNANANWTDGATLTPPENFFVNGDAVTFDDTPASKNVVIAPAGVIATSMTVANTAGNDYTFTGDGGITTTADPAAYTGADVTPDGKLHKTGAGALNFTNTAPNNFLSGIEISGGTIGFTNGAQLGDGGNGIHFTEAATLRSNATTTLANNLNVDPGKAAIIDTAGNTLTLAGRINFDTIATLVKTGDGALSLTADSSGLLGDIRVDQGILSLDTATGKLGGVIHLATGATLAGNGGAAVNTVNAAADSVIAPGALEGTKATQATQGTGGTTSVSSAPASPATLTIANLNLDTTTLRFNLFAADASDRLDLTGALTQTGAQTIDIGLFQSGTFTIGGNLAALYPAAQVTIGGITPAANSRQQALLTTNGNDLLLETQSDISRILWWTGATSGTWTIADADWTDNAATPTELFAGGDQVHFDDTAPAAAPRDITIAGSGVTVSDMFVQGTSNYTFSGAGITADPASIISGPVVADGVGKLNKTGSGTLAFDNAANNFTGGIDIAGGAITFTDASQLGDGGAGGNGILFNGDALLANASGADQTLPNNITVAADVTGTLDTGANNLSLTGALAAADATGTLAKIGTGTLVLAANDANASAGAANLALAINEGALLLNSATFAGTIDTAADTLFTSAGSSSIGAARVSADSTLQIASGTLNAASLQFAASSTLTGAGALAGAATLDGAGAVVADIAGGNTLTLAGQVGGAGGWLKTGAGELRIVGADALGNIGATQIDEGALRITGIAVSDAPAVAQAITLNGGTLAFNTATVSATTPITTESAANNWAGITIAQGDTATAAASAVYGTNDIIHVASGTQAFSIQGGIHVAVDADDGSDAAVTVLGNTTNNFTGLVLINSGTLQVSDTRHLGFLGTGNASKIILNGGALELSAGDTANISTTRAVELRANGAVAVDDGVTATIGALNQNAAASATAALTFLKAGSGTLTIRGAIQPTNVTVDAGRLVAQLGGAMSTTTGTLAINAGATFELAATGATQSGTVGFVAGQPFTVLNTGTISAAITGAGTLEVTQNKYYLTSRNIDIARINIIGANTAVIAGGGGAAPVNFSPSGTINVDQGTLILAALDQNIGAVTLANGATLAFLKSGTRVPQQVTDSGTIPAHYTTDGLGFKTATLASLNTTGGGATPTLLFNTNLALGRADHLAVNAPVSGTYNIGINNWGELPSRYTAAVELLKASGDSTAVFNPLTPQIDIGLFSYAVSTTTTSGGSMSVRITGTGAMSNSASLINAMAAMMPMSFFTELNSVTQRMGELHFDDRGERGGAAAWVRGYGEKINYNDKVTGSPFGERQFGGEAGVDYKLGIPKYNIYAGLFAGYGQGQRDYSIAGEGSIDSVSGGGYITFATTSGWYVDGALKVNNFRNQFTAISPTGESTTASYHNWAGGVSLEIGKYQTLDYGWFIEPQIQAAFTTFQDKDYATASGMSVTLRSATIAHARAGLMVGRVVETARHGTLNVYLKACGGGQWTTGGALYVATPSGQNARYAPAIKGYNLEADAGLAWQFTKATQVYFDYSTTDAEYYIKPWGLNFGIRHMW